LAIVLRLFLCPSTFKTMATTEWKWMWLESTEQENLPQSLFTSLTPREPHVLLLVYMLSFQNFECSQGKNLLYFRQNVWHTKIFFIWKIKSTLFIFFFFRTILFIYLFILFFYSFWFFEP
jgi:hypothetical protein